MRTISKPKSTRKYIKQWGKNFPLALLKIVEIRKDLLKIGPVV